MGAVVNEGVSQNFPEAFAVQALAQANVQNPSRAPFAVTPHDTNKLARIPQSIYVGGAGDITLRGVDSSTDVLFKNLPAGITLNVQAEYIKAAGTTATYIVAFG